MAITVAFDVYGTLIDTTSIETSLQEFAGEKSAEFSEVWRWKQLEYSFRRGLMKIFQPFSACTREALDYTCEFVNVPLEQRQKDHLLETYKTLPAFKDVREGLKRSRENGFSMHAFSNGSAEAVEVLLRNASIRNFFHGVVSTEEIRSFKPDPGVYLHFLQRSGAAGPDAWLVSSNPFDVIGAVSAGMRAAWVKRTPEKIFDPWGIEPTITVSGLAELAEGILGVTAGD